MNMHHLPSPRAVALLAIAALTLAAAVVVQESGPNQAAHFALVRALASGTAEIDPGETIDASYVDGRYYAAKAPGLAMFALPWHGMLRAVGLQDGSPASAADYRSDVWEMGLFGAVLPMLVLLLLMYVAAERLEPGYGLTASVLLGAGTLLLPFSTLFFDHVLSAALGFAAFVLLFDRASSGRTWTVAAAGLIAGVAIVVEFPLGIVAVVLAGYAARGEPLVQRLVTYTAGVLVGVLPLLAYNWWAFGSPARLSYTNALKAPAGSGSPVVGANDEGFYGVGVPDARAALSLLVSEKGLLVVTPVVVAAVVGLPMLWRAGRRAEALVCAVIPALFLAYNAAYYLPFGGQSPGPRFLVPALPFLALPLACTLRARPLVVAGLGVASVVVMALATTTGPLTGVEYGIGTWLDRLGRSDLVETVPGRLGVDGEWVAALPFVALLAVALGLSLSRLPLLDRVTAEGPLLLGSLGAWLLLVLVGPDLVPADSEHGTLEGVVAVVVLLGTLAIAVHVGRRSGPIALLPVAPLLALAAPVFDDRPRLALLVSVVILAVASVAWVGLVRHRAWSAEPLGAAAEASPAAVPDLRASERQRV